MLASSSAVEGNLRLPRSTARIGRGRGLGYPVGEVPVHDEGVGGVGVGTGGSHGLGVAAGRVPVVTHRNSSQRLGLPLEVLVATTSSTGLRFW